MSKLTQEELVSRIDSERMFSDEDIRAAFERLDMQKLAEPINDKLQRRLIFFTTYHGFAILKALCDDYKVSVPNGEQIAAFILAQLLGEQIFDDLISTKR